jgi:hypothetical protein
MHKLKYLPKERLIQRFSELTGISYLAAERLAKREGIDLIADYLEVHLLVPRPKEVSQNRYAPF